MNFLIFPELPFSKSNIFLSRLPIPDFLGSLDRPVSRLQGLVGGDAGCCAVWRGSTDKVGLKTGFLTGKIRKSARGGSGFFGPSGIIWGPLECVQV